MAKITYVTLYAEGIGDKDFTIEHAENIMRMPNHGYWMVSDKEKTFEWTENGFRARKNTQGDKDSE